MRWLLLDVLIVLLALGVLAALLFGLWRKVTALGREVSRAGDAIGRATDDLARQQAQLPPSA